MAEKTSTIWEDLRKPFDPASIGKLPKGGITLDYVGHAAVTDRLNTVAGPDDWNWEPLALDERGLPVVDRSGGLWIKLTVHGVTRLGYGDGSSNMKVLIGDALRNAAMRFGVALDLWTKEELESTIADPSLKNPVQRTEQQADGEDAFTAALVDSRNADTPPTKTQIDKIHELAQVIGYTETALEGRIKLIKTKGEAGVFIRKLMEQTGETQSPEGGY